MHYRSFKTLLAVFAVNAVFASMALNGQLLQTSAEPAEQPVTLPAGLIVAQGAAVQATPMPAEPPRQDPPKPAAGAPAPPRAARRRSSASRAAPRDSGTGEPGAEVQRPRDGGGLR